MLLNILTVNIFVYNVNASFDKRDNDIRLFISFYKQNCENVNCKNSWLLIVYNIYVFLNINDSLNFYHFFIFQLVTVK